MKKLISVGLLMSVLAGCSHNTQELKKVDVDKKPITNSQSVTLSPEKLVREEAFKDVVLYQHQMIEIAKEFANWKAEHPEVKLLPSEIEAKVNEISLKRLHMSKDELRKAHEEALQLAIRDI